MVMIFLYFNTHFFHTCMAYSSSDFKGGVLFEDTIEPSNPSMDGRYSDEPERYGIPPKYEVDL